MRTYVCTILAIWSVVTSGCSSKHTQEAGRSDELNVEGQNSEVFQNRMVDVVEVNRLDLVDGTLVLEYRVNNIYPYDIWICEDINAAVGSPGPVVGRYDGPPVVETWIQQNDTLRIRLIGNLDGNLIDARHVWARYRRLGPNQGRSQVVRLSLPVRDYSPVFRGDYPRTSKEPRMLHYVLFIAGFFKGDLHALLAQSKRRDWPFENWDPNRELGETRTYTPPPSEDPDVAFVTWPWEGTRLLEHYAQFTVTDVNVPALIATRRSN